jgi:hypothetical protein
MLLFVLYTVCQTLPELEIIVVDDNAERGQQKTLQKIIHSLRKKSHEPHARDIRCEYIL